ncbi:DUF3488 and DUF4129 domain-containing transglutaminase family protein [Aeromicrobium sp. 179-A 4D2 NHS]|uniref:transglutaminase TgpA family protein n=1 Tax=Aeromicrobium sp. 179-A 4D2 NHS TaxID=3142375 RepID=UPI00399F7116
MTRDRRAEALDTLVVLLAAITLLGGFDSLFRGAGWVVLVLAVLVPAAVAIVLVRLVAPALATAAGVVTSALMIVWVFVPGSTAFGLPTPATLDALGRLVDRARVVIVEQAAPIDPPESVVLLVAFAFAVTFVLADAVARQTWRVPLLGALWTTMLVVPSVISMETPPWWVFAGTALAWLWLWWSETAHVGLVPRGGAVITALGALVFALVVPMLTPAIEPTSSDLGVSSTRMFTRGINPMIELGRNLRQSDGRRVLTYTTTSEDGVYLKAAVLRNFDGETWSPSPVITDEATDGTVVADGIATREATTNVRIESLRATYLPVPDPALEIRGLEGQWEWLRDGSTVRAIEPTTTEDQTYTVVSLEREPTADQVRALDKPGDDLDAYRALPRRVPPIIERLARAEAGRATNDYDRMVALQDWLRGAFTYSIQAPVEQGFDGNGLEAMAEFLVERTGYCVHFASTLAVMGRLLDVPTRVAVGYAPGDNVLSRTTKSTTYALNSDDLHAWTEAYFPDLGWVPFDATPGVGEETSFPETAEGGGVGADDSEVPEAAENESGSPRDARDGGSSTDAEQETGRSWRPALVALMAVAVLGAVPGIVRQVRRRRRWSAGSGSTEPLWSEVSDTARDLGIEPDRSETPRGFARRLEDHGVDADALRLLVTEVERDRYAGGATAPRLDEARKVVDSLQAAQRPRVRWLARVMPRSLLR